MPAPDPTEHAEVPEDLEEDWNNVAPPPVLDIEPGPRPPLLVTVPSAMSHFTDYARTGDPLPDTWEEDPPTRRVSLIRDGENSGEVRQYLLDHPGSTVAMVARALDITQGNMSSYLYKQCAGGYMMRIRGKGPRGGYGYYVIPEEIRKQILYPDEVPRPPAKSSWERLVEDDQEPDLT